MNLSAMARNVNAAKRPAPSSPKPAYIMQPSKHELGALIGSFIVECTGSPRDHPTVGPPLKQTLRIGF
jgi:hypothetical protein